MSKNLERVNKLEAELSAYEGLNVDTISNELFKKMPKLIKELKEINEEMKKYREEPDIIRNNECFTEDFIAIYNYLVENNKNI